MSYCVLKITGELCHRVWQSSVSIPAVVFWVSIKGVKKCLFSNIYLFFLPIYSLTEVLRWFFKNFLHLALVASVCCYCLPKDKIDLRGCVLYNGIYRNKTVMHNLRLSSMHVCFLICFFFFFVILADMLTLWKNLVIFISIV